METRDFTVIENKELKEKPVQRVTNPIAKKFVGFKNNKEKFSVKDLFKN